MLRWRPPEPLPDEFLRPPLAAYVRDDVWSVTQPIGSQGNLRHEHGAEVLHAREDPAVITAICESEPVPIFPELSEDILG